ncbi:hypothetical protein D3C74_218940 [compost metagenome]
MGRIGLGGARDQTGSRNGLLEQSSPVCLGTAAARPDRAEHTPGGFHRTAARGAGANAGSLGAIADRAGGCGPVSATCRCDAADLLSGGSNGGRGILRRRGIAGGPADGGSALVSNRNDRSRNARGGSGFRAEAESQPGGLSPGFLATIRAVVERPANRWATRRYSRECGGAGATEYRRFRCRRRTSPGRGTRGRRSGDRKLALMPSRGALPRGRRSDGGGSSCGSDFDLAA